LAEQEPGSNQPNAGENFRAETDQSRSNDSFESDQSKSTVQEHREPIIDLIEPSPFERAQTEVIEREVIATAFDPTPDLIAKLHRKARLYGVTGFRVAAIIARAFKLVEHTSNQPRSLEWFAAVVENALRETKLPDKTEHHRAAFETPTRRGPRWTPAPCASSKRNPTGPILDPISGVDQVSLDRWEKMAPRHQLKELAAKPESSPEPALCGFCGSDGVVNGTAPAIWCSCDRGRQKRRERPDYVDRLNRSAWLLSAVAPPRVGATGATIEAVNAKAHYEDIPEPQEVARLRENV
jgi:hypothetical protein